MYIEGNALILGDSSYLEHHGILGQKWGVRRFQNKDGTRTAAGKKRDAENLKSSQEAKNVKSKIHSYINKQLSSEDLDTGKSNYDFASNLIKDPDFEKVIMPVVQDIRQTKAKYGNKEPYEFTGDEHQAYMNDIDRLDKKTGKLAIAIGLAEKGEPHKKSTPPEGEYERVDMFRYALARYLDEHSPDGYSDEGDWIYHSSMEGTFFIEDGTLYLSHHGIRGQRWGVRRFQNRDGSLTNAGRKRLGYATKSAVQTVGKAFKAGVKVGGNAVKAAKAHHEEAEAKKKEKKKEKASQSRLGVLANKDLFTDDELRALNQRFKVEDELKMASIQKGVEIAKAVGTIASNAATAAKAYEDITGQSLSPIKRQAAELKKQQDAEDRARKIAREDAEEARKVAQEERNVKTYEQELRKATASADKEEFLAKKTKAQADQEILKALKQARDFDKPDDDDDDPPKPPNGGGGSDDGSSWVQKATSGGKNPFEKMLYDNNPEYKAAKDAHDEKVAQKERMEYLDRHIAEREREKQAEKAAKDKALMDMINQSNARTGRGQSNPTPTQTPSEPEYQSNLLKQLKPVYFGPDLREASERERGRAEAEKHNKEWEQQFESKEAADKWLRDRVAETQARNKAAKDNAGNSNGSKSTTQDSDALFSQKGSLPIDKDRYRNRKAAEKAKKVKEDVTEDRAKKQDEKAVDQTINDIIEAQRRNTERTRNMDPHAYDRAVAKEYVKEKAKETIDKIPETLGNLNPINRAAKKIANKVEQEGYENTRKALKKQYEDMAESQGRDEANYVMYNTRIAGLQGQGYSEKQARQIADSDPTFSAKRNRRSEHAQRVSELETARKNTAKKLDQAEKSAVDDYYKKIYLDAYAPGTDKREALDREYKSAMNKISKLREENQQLYEKGIKDAQKILEHSFSIQNGVLFVDRSVSLSHHGVKGQRWGVRRFQNEDGSLTEKGRKHYEKALAKEKRKQASSDAIRGTLERQHPFAVTGSAIAGAIAAGMSIAATGGASVAVIAAGSAISAAVSAGLTHVTYSASEAWEGRGTRMRSKKIAKYENMLKQSDMEEGMYHVENGTLFINAGEPYLEHHGVLGMKWGKHLRAGKGPASAPASAGGGGGGAPEEDEETKKKIEEAAKKAGLSVDDYRKKFADKVAEIKKAAYNAAGGSHKKNAEGWRKMAQEESNAARASERSSHENSARAASQDRKYGSGGDVYRRAADSDRENAETHRSNAKARSERAASEQAAYEKSLAGRYDKMKADQARKKSAKSRKQLTQEGPKAKKKVRIESASAMGLPTNDPYRIPVDARRWGRNATNKSKVSVGKRGSAPKTILNPKHTDTSHRRKSVGEIMNNAKNPTPGDTPIPNPTQYTQANRPRGREKYFKLGQESKGVKKRSRRVRHSDGSSELYTEGTRLVIYPKA